jgi:PAS domain S-box-containing protein
MRDAEPSTHEIGVPRREARCTLASRLVMSALFIRSPDTAAVDRFADGRGGTHTDARRPLHSGGSVTGSLATDSIATGETVERDPDPLVLASAAYRHANGRSVAGVVPGDAHFPNDLPGDPIEEVIRNVVEMARHRLGLTAASLCEVDAAGLHTVRVTSSNAPSNAQRCCALPCAAGGGHGSVAPIGSGCAANDLHVRSIDWNAMTCVSAPVIGADGVSSMLCGRYDATAIDSDHASALDRQLTLLADVLAHARTLISRREGPVADARARIHDVIEQQSIRPVFQPVYSAADGSLSDVEALSRFPGSATPDVWFAEARAVGLGIELELAAIRAAIKQLALLPQNVRIAFNASPDTIVDPRLLNLLAATSSHRTVIELTEHHAVLNYDELVAAVGALRAIDVSVAIDDVGAGFANFAHILHLRPDMVKVDMSLTRGNDCDPAKQRVIESIVHVAHEINASIVAEGVETLGELRSLAELGVTHIQGYLLAKPSAPPFEAVAPQLAAIPYSVRRRIRESQEAQIAQRRFDLTFDHAPIGMAVVSLDGQLRHVNAAMAAILERGVAELESMTFQELTHPDDLDSDLDLFHECLHGHRGSYRIQKRYLLPEGDVVWVDLTVAVVRDAAGNPLSFIAEVVDLTPGSPAFPTDSDTARPTDHRRDGNLTPRSEAGAGPPTTAPASPQPDRPTFIGSTTTT